MSKNKFYKVAITETLRRIVMVEAASEAEAHKRAVDAWYNGEVRLEAQDSEGAEFYVIDTESCCESDKELEHIEGKECFVLENAIGNNKERDHHE